MKPAALLLLAGAALAAAKPTAKPTVYFIRHGEKPSDENDQGLSAQGLQRAQCLRTVFGAASQYNIGHIMAQTPKKDGSRQRPYDTVAPLAGDLGIPVDTSCGRDDSDCVQNVVKSYSGSGNILICWEHKALQDLATALGTKDVSPYPSDHFDLIWTDPSPFKHIMGQTHSRTPVLLARLSDIQPSRAILGTSTIVAVKLPRAEDGQNSTPIPAVHPAHRQPPSRNHGRRQGPVDQNPSRQSADTAPGSNVFLKLENLQPSGSFKSRGIGNFMAAKLRALRDDTNGTCGTRAEAHFYSSSAGNAGLACVHAAVTLGCQATVVVPLSTTAFIIAKLRQAGATDVIQRGASWQEADDYLTRTLIEHARAKGEAAVYVPPFDAPEIWDGNAGISREIARQLGGTARHYPVSFKSRPSGSGEVDAIVCSVGGGGLFSGVMQGLDELHMRHTRVIAVETLGADSLSQAVAKKELVTLPAITSLATSLGARTVCEKALEYALRDTVSTVVLSDSEAISACRRFADEERFLVELACAVCPALCYNGRLAELVPGFSKDSVVVLVVCGGSNMSIDIMDKYAVSQAAKPKA
ncbi:L-serine dehydratase [Tolypocladium ophioglossoides CBS 100239]|uniref:L-serine ammonia-lyase n=1 Tax=Tolypocladium ophioglossoides (strain CBS 100239) TaxID=1163406 RepID=A0A0L0NFI5_TOLOC|nr:L-serine dehydratase [Tolypocladium ophioglossoides CBS 100239]